VPSIPDAAVSSRLNGVNRRGSWSGSIPEPVDDLRLHSLGLRTQLGGHRLLLVAALAQAHELGHVLDPMSVRLRP
jgi:hypothetical protein